MADTGWLNPSSVGPDNTWTNPTNAYADDSAATSIGSGNLQAYGGFNVSLPAGALVTGIEVRAKGAGSVSPSGKTGIELSTNGGTSYTATNYQLTFPSGGYAYVGPVGSSTDLWGKLWTATLLNNTNFRVRMSVVQGTFGVDVLQVRVTYTPSTATIDTPNAAVSKSYLYKVYNGSSFLGLLPNVISDFAFNQDINSAGSQISITIGKSADTTDTTLLGLGTATNLPLIKNGNRVVVTEYSSYHPNGRTAFSGIIESWSAPFGGGEESIKINVYSDGKDLDNFLVQGSPLVNDVSATTATATTTLQTAGKLVTNGTVKAGQTFKTGSSVTNLGAIGLFLNGTADVTLKVYASAPSDIYSGTPLASVTQHVSTTSAQEVQMAFSLALTVASSTTYFYSVEVATDQTIIISTNANAYADGQAYTGSSAISGGAWTGQSGTDLAFKTYSNAGSTTASFGTQDPVGSILVSIMNTYATNGGLIKYNANTIDPSAITVPYTFTTASVLDGIKTVLTLAPSGYYYYVDLSTNYLYFKQTGTKADHTFTKGKNLGSLNLGASIENVKNNILFTGGAVSGSNLYKKYSDPTSVALYGVRLDRLSDGRVTVSTTADAIGQSELANLKAEQFQTEVVVYDRLWDISLFRPGQLVGFNGYGGIVDTLLLQIVRIAYTPEAATLTLGTLPPRINTDIEQINRDLLVMQTAANPSAPS